MRTQFTTFALVLLLGGGLAKCLPAGAVDWEKIVLDSKQGRDWRVEMTGNFGASKSVSPGDHVFSYKTELISSRGQLLYLYQYNFVGRTGDKTFELLQISREGSSPRVEKKFSVYFDPDAPLPLKIPLLPLDTSCSASEAPKLKLVKLSGNELEVQVLLPECLKR